MEYYDPPGEYKKTLSDYLPFIMIIIIVPFTFFLHIRAGIIKNNIELYVIQKYNIPPNIIWAGGRNWVVLQNGELAPIPQEIY